MTALFSAGGCRATGISLVTRYANGTSSIRRKSSADELRKDAVGSDELYGGMTASKDMAAGIETSGRDGYLAFVLGEVRSGAG